MESISLKRFIDRNEQNKIELLFEEKEREKMRIY